MQALKIIDCLSLETALLTVQWLYLESSNCINDVVITANHNSEVRPSLS